MKANINDLHISQYNNQGYLVIPDVFSQSEIMEMRSESDRLLELMVNSSLANQRTSERLDLRVLPSGNQVIRKIQPINDLSLYFTKVSQDNRVISTIRELISDDPELIEEKLSYKQHLPVPIDGIHALNAEDRFFAHCDWAYHKEQGYPPKTINVGIWLDDSPPMSGPLQVWPESHKKILHHDKIGKSYIVPEELLQDYNPVELIPEAGAVIYFHGLLVHSSKPNSTRLPRRIMFFNYVAKSESVGFDVRNGPRRYNESPYEWNYQIMKDKGTFIDKFKIT